MAKRPAAKAVVFPKTINLGPFCAKRRLGDLLKKNSDGGKK